MILTELNWMKYETMIMTQCGAALMPDRGIANAAKGRPQSLYPYIY